MASSLPLQGGSTTIKTVKESITQVDHGFQVGDVIRWDPTLVKYVKAQANSAMNAEVIGVVNFRESTAAFEVTYSGNIELTDGKFTGVSAAPVLFLSAGLSGELQTSPPSTIGSVVKPVLTKTKGNTYLVHNFLGTQIGGSSTISVDEIQPVGTIMPFAGSVIPDTWLLCDGNAQSRTTYPELFSKICYTDGDQVPMYGYIAGITGSGTAWDSIRQNDILHFRSNGTSPWGVAEPYGINAGDDIRAQVVGVPSASNMYFQLRIIPKYEAVQLGSGATQRTLSRFQFPNKLFASGSAIAGNYRVFQGADGTLPLRVGPTSTQFTVTQVTIQQFLTPDLRGRFALGTSSVTDTARGEENETEPTFISSLGTYAMGSLGGEEAHALTNTEMPSHTHGSGTLATSEYLGFSLYSGDGTNNAANRPNTTDETTVNTNNFGRHTHTITGSVAAAGSNTPHNNMPPYLAVRYIIKAKPYTRAAIIDGIDIPYNSLLVRDLRSRNVGGPDTSNNNINDLIICTNKNDVLDSGIGTERIRIKGNTGLVGIGNTNPVVELDVTGTAAFSSRVGIGKTDPQVALDIVGQARSSILLSEYSTAPNSTLTTKEYVDSISPVGFSVGSVGNDATFTVRTGKSGKVLILVESTVKANYANFGPNIHYLTLGGTIISSRISKTMEFDTRETSAIAVLITIYTGTPNTNYTVNHKVNKVNESSPQVPLTGIWGSFTGATWTYISF